MTTPETERATYITLTRALNALKNPHGHQSGAYGLVYEARCRACPDVHNEEATKSQAPLNDGINWTRGT